MEWWLVQHLRQHGELMLHDWRFVYDANDGSAATIPSTTDTHFLVNTVALGRGSSKKVENGWHGSGPENHELRVRVETAAAARLGRSCWLATSSDELFWPCAS